MTADENPESPHLWRSMAQRHQGSWWEDWTTWAADRAGEKIEPPRTGSERHPVLGDGPGEYVRT
jgi:polyhydroxyalkanoate synthase